MVNLSNVNNIADVDKPISTLEQTALNARMDLSGGTFTGDISTNGNIIFTSSSTKLKYYVAAIDAAGKVLMSDVNGNLTLQNPTSGGGVGYPTYGYRPYVYGINITCTGVGISPWININNNGTLNTGLYLDSGKHLLFYKASVYVPSLISTATNIETCISTNSDVSYVDISVNGINFTKHTVQKTDSGYYMGEQMVLVLNITTPSYYYVFVRCSYLTTTNMSVSTTSGQSYLHSIKIS